FSDWAKVTITRHAPQYLLEDGELRRSIQPTPLGVVRLKSSISFLSTFEAVSKRQPQNERDFFGAIFETLNQREEILQNDETRLLTPLLFEEAQEYFERSSKESTLDHADEALFMRFSEIAYGGVCLPDGSFGKFEHLVVDEVQDVSATQLASLIEAVPEPYQLTLVGDTAQQVSEENTFPGWDQLRRRWSLKEEISKFIKLEVSHRSTYPIMKLADRIQQRNTIKKGRPGRRPIWFHTRGEEECVGYMLRWLETGIQKYPHAMTAIICPNLPTAKYALTLLEPTFGSMVRLGDNHSFSFEEGIVVTDVHQVKGLEFTNVLLWDVSSRAYPANRLSQNLLYIGVTRAEENLALSSWSKPSPFLPHIHSKMVRGYDFTIEDEEEGNRRIQRS
ncbi:MAG: ATP-binding domain-containing protein, partial [Bdellovibrionales bacterium]|nr:ATP-binding domain-containing protein [Bdellovibrionales bacterium]